MPAISIHMNLLCWLLSFAIQIFFSCSFARSAACAPVPADGFPGPLNSEAPSSALPLPLCAAIPLCPSAQSTTCAGAESVGTPASNQRGISVLRGLHTIESIVSHSSHSDPGAMPLVRVIVCVVFLALSKLAATKFTRFTKFGIGLRGTKQGMCL
jgi:hypothetical protein